MFGLITTFMKKTSTKSKNPDWSCDPSGFSVLSSFLSCDFFSDSVLLIYVSFCSYARELLMYFSRGYKKFFRVSSNNSGSNKNESCPFVELIVVYVVLIS